MSKLTFKDHFSGHADQYKQYRPGYPRELFEYLADIAPARELAWDCATGNGQAATALAGYFKQVIATDASKTQLQNNIPVANIDYRVMPAETTDLPAASVDLVTVAQALHWFDLAKFFAEVRRVLKPGGVLAVWSYNLLHIDADIDVLVNRLYGETLDEYWPPERRLVEANYAGIDFPFETLPAPAFAMHSDWTLEQLLGYLRTWSATRAYIRDHQQDPVEAIAAPLAGLWGVDGCLRRVSWPMPVILCRN